MAVVVGTPKKVGFNKIEALTFEAATVAADGITFDVKNSRNEDIVILAMNTDAGNAYDVSVAAPGTNGGYAASDTNLSLADVPAGGVVAIRVETAKFKNKDGKIKLIPENIAVKFAMIV